jgi:hypothetical protein
MTATLRHRLLLGAILVGAFVVRCRFIGDVFLSGRILPYDPDSSYHLWRIEWAAHHGLHPPRFDRFVNAPAGARVIWPDGFDASLAALARAFGTHTRFGIEVVSLLAVPLLGMLAVLAVYAFARKIADAREAMLAAGIAAVLPAHVLGAILGLVDHHVIELLVPPLALAMALSEWRGAPVLMGALMAALVYCVPTALLHIAVLVVAVVAGAFGALRAGGRAMPLLRTSSFALAIAALFVLPGALGRSGYAFYEPSRLPPLALAASAAMMGALTWAARRGQRGLVAACAAELPLAAVIVWLALRGAAGFIGGAGVLRLVAEAQPITVGSFGALEMFSLALPLVPILLVLVAWRRPSAGTWSLAGAGLIAGVLFAFQHRFEVLLAPWTAVAAALGTVHAWRRWPRGVRWLAVAALVFALIPSVSWLVRAHLAGASQLATLETAEWMKAHTPPAGDRDSDAEPTYTVLPLWGDGGHFAYLGDRPVVVGAFYHGDYASGLADSIAILFGDGDPTPRLDRLKVRYVAVPAIDRGVVAVHRELMGLGAPVRPPLYSRLFDSDGSALVSPDGHVLPAMGYLRLVHESPFSITFETGSVPAMKVFERVAGAELRGGCRAGVVRARATGVTSSGRVLVFVGAANCANDQFALRMPYPGTIELSASGAVARVNVDEVDVREGRAMNVDWDR